MFSGWVLILWKKEKPRGFLIYLIPMAFLHSMPSSSWALFPHGNQDFIPGQSSEGLLLPWLCLPIYFSYLFTSMWQHLVLLVSPSGNLGGSAALVTFQHSEIPANLNGKGIPACSNKLPLEPPHAAVLEIVLTILGRILQLGKQSQSGSAGIRAAAEVLFSFKDGFSPFGWN